MGMDMSIGLSTICTMDRETRTNRNRSRAGQSSRLKYAREQAGLNQEQLAALVDRNRKTISHWETGERGLDWEDAEAVGSALKVDPVWLLLGEEYVERHPSVRRIVEMLAEAPPERQDVVAAQVMDYLGYILSRRDGNEPGGQ